MTRGPRWAPALVAGLVLVGCSGGDGNGGRRSGATTTTVSPTARSSVAWKAVEADPCRLLTRDDVRQVVGEAAPAPQKDGPPRVCRYDLGEGRTLEVDLYQPLTPAARAARLRGTTPIDVAGAHRLVLDTPGAGVLVARPNALALLAYRDSTGERPLDDQQLSELAGRVAERLPAAPAAAARPGTTSDPCAVVPPSVLLAGLTAGDAPDPQTCAYRHADGTTISVRIDPQGSMGEAGSLGAPWPVAPGAVVHAVDHPTPPGGALEGFVPLPRGIAVISVSSSALSTTRIAALARTAATRVIAAHR